MAIPNTALFHEKQGVMYYVTNWRDRFHDGGKPLLVKLSQRHLKLYQKYNTKGRSQKSVYYGMMRDKGRLATTRENRILPARKPIKVEVDLDILTKDQLIATIMSLSRVKMPYLTFLGIKDLRHLYQTMERIRSEPR